MEARDESARDHRPWSIAVVLHDFELGGAERSAIRLANAWALLGGNVILLLGSSNGGQRGLVDKAVSIVVADPPIRRSLNSPSQLGRWAGSKMAALRVSACFLPGNSYFRAARSLSRAAPKGIPLFATISNVLWRADRSLPGNLLFSFLTRHRLRNVTGIVSMSHSLLDDAKRIFGRPVHFAVAPNALFDSLPVAYSTPRRPWHVCAVGRLVRQKNFALLLRSLALLRDLPITLSIIGDGEQGARLRRLAASLGLEDRVTFVGEVADARPYLAQAEVMMLTSGYEGYPAVVVEALAAGTFVVASECSPAISDLLRSPVLGSIVKSGRASEFAGALRGYFSGPARSEDARRRVVAQSLARSHLAANSAQCYLELMGLDASAG